MQVIFKTGLREKLMRPTIQHMNPAKEFKIPEGCYIIELTTATHDPEMSIAQARVEPTVTTQWHRLKGTVERYIIIAGEGIAEIGDLPPTIVKAGDVIVIPADCRQRITNTGKDDLIFWCVCTPPFQDDIYEIAEDH